MTTKPTTFKVDNQLIANAPRTFLAKRGKINVEAVQLALPGDFAPFGPFDYWATLALYSKVNPKNPIAPVETTYTDLLRTLEFAKTINDALEGYSTFTSDQYHMIEEALHRLFTVEVNWKNYWTVKTGKKGRPKKQWVEYHGRLLASFQYTYAPGVTPPSMQRDKAKKRNVNKAKKSTGEVGPAIYREVEGPRPIGIAYTFAPDMVRGLTGDNPNIGATILPVKIFELRTQGFGQNPTATHLLLWVCRTTSSPFKIDLSKLADLLNMNTKNPSRNRAALIGAFAMLKRSGVVEDYTIDDVKNQVTFTKSPDWHFARAGEEDVGNEPPALPEATPAKKA